MAIVKTLVIRKTSTKWIVIIRVSAHGTVADTKLATFVDRAIAIVPMAAALVAFKKYLMIDAVVYEGKPEGYETMVRLEIFE